MRPGDDMGEFHLEAMLGEGAMGRVFRARRDGVPIALKVLREELARDEVYRRRFAHEARAASEVRNRHLVTVLGAGEVRGRPYLAMEYVRGPTLEERIEATGPLRLGDVVTVASGLASALDALHRVGLLHRDVKAANVMFRDDQTAVLTDFGLAKGRAYTVLTRPGQALGTLEYMAPELIQGRPATAQSDIYAFGCLVYECLTGDTPFGDRDMFAMGNAHMDDIPDDVRDRRPDVPEPMGWAVAQALAKDPARRPTTASMYARMIAAGAR